MEFQVARLQEIVNKIQYFSKMHFKNAIDIKILLETEGLEIDDINKLISAGVKKVGFSNLEQFVENEYLLLPVEKVFLGELDNQNINAILANFETLESIVDIEQIQQIGEINLKTGRVTNVLLKLNVLSEIKKFGVSPAEINDLSYQIAVSAGVRLRGITSFIPNFGDKMQKTTLRKITTIYKILNQRYKGFDFLSVNYLDNMRELIEEGVNEIRIGINSFV